MGSAARTGPIKSVDRACGTVAGAAASTQSAADTPWSASTTTYVRIESKERWQRSICVGHIQRTFQG